MEFLERVIQLENSVDISQWFKLTKHLTDDMGFGKILIGFLAIPHQSLNQAIIITDYPPRWRATYTQNNYANIDPVVIHAKNNTNRILWNDTLYVSKKQKNFLEEVKLYNLSSGVTLPMHGPKQETGLVSLQINATNVECAKFIANNAAELSLLKDITLHKCLHFFCVVSTPKIQLSDREKEVLKWVAENKTTWEISRICYCSEANINYHLSNIRRKFGVTTRRAAVVQAVSKGLITI
ncbi:MAG: hypothetical protein JWQ79_4124 [Mucilaginibacter sp.]|nr:hypothetical protein [Mucilaginibacter sp.]